MSQDEVRFDSIWRRIKVDRYSQKLGGKFPDAQHRLDRLNNWGSLGWLYSHATATKQAHHDGIIHNANHLMAPDRDPRRQRHEPSFRIAVHALHWGHMPLSYAGCEALIRASHVDEDFKIVLNSILEDVVNDSGIECGADDHASQCLPIMQYGLDPFNLYRWLSAWLVLKRWKSIYKAVKTLPEGLRPDSGELKAEVVKTLVC